MQWIVTDFNLGFLSGILYLLLGLFAIMMVDIKTRRFDFLCDINEFLIFMVILFWIAVLPAVFLIAPRATDQSRNRGMLE